MSGRNGAAWAMSCPRIGQRMIKTAIAVFICLIFYYLRGYRGEDMPTEAAVTAIICMQPYVQDTREYALNRMAGTLIGAVWGLALLFLLLLFPVLGKYFYIVYALAALGALGALYTSVAFRKTDASGLAAIVFVCIVAAFPEIENPIADTLERILGVIIGTAVAIGVNVFHLPRKRNRDILFFIRSADLIPDRFAQISPAVLFQLNSLVRDGAKICLISRHAPAFFTAQLHALVLHVPMIVMDGAALYDPNENRYLYTEKIRESDAARLIKRLNDLNLSYFIYTVHRKKTCIFHRGILRENEREVLNQLRRSPYRDYLNEDIYAPDEIIYIKIIDQDFAINRLKKRLYTFIQGGGLRSSVQVQTGVPGVSGLYIYSKKATIQNAEERVTRLLRMENPAVIPEEIFPSAGYRSEHDAIHLLTRLRDRYAPIFAPNIRRTGK